MSGTPDVPGGLQIDPKAIALVDKLIEKTKQGKLYWAKAKSSNEDAGAFSSAVFAERSTTEVTMRMTFNAVGLMGVPTWTSFNVVTKEGTILNIQNTTVPGVIAKLAGIKADAIREKINELFAIVSQVGEGSFERALKQLDRL